MVSNPKIIVDICDYNGNVIFNNIRVLYGRVQNLYGINADWFKILIHPKDLQGIQSTEYVVAGDRNITAEQCLLMYPELLRLKIKFGYDGNYFERIHGFIYEVAYTSGTIGSLLKVSGGDVCYFMNKTYKGDYMLQRDSNTYKWLKGEASKKEYAFKDTSRLDILTRVLDLKESDMVRVIGEPMGTPYKPFSKNLSLQDILKMREYRSKHGFKLLLVDMDGSENQNLYGVTKHFRYDLANPDARLYYQINNQTMLEILDDICFKSGWSATVLPAKVTFDNIPAIMITANWKKRKPNSSKKKITINSNDDEESWIKFTKMTHFEAGLKICINYWDWQFSVRTGTSIENMIEGCRRGKAQWMGSEEPDVSIQAYLDYENLNEDAVNRRSYLSINRLVTQRITVSGGLEPDPDLFPGDEVIFDGYEEPFNRQYLITATTLSLGERGFNMQFSARIPDLISTTELQDVKNDPYNKVLIGSWDTDSKKK